MKLTLYFAQEVKGSNKVQEELKHNFWCNWMEQKLVKMKES